MARTFSGIVPADPGATLAAVAVILFAAWAAAALAARRTLRLDPAAALRQP
jgi:ABC-type antimicrobial peptide transport system permease subunit